jgi:hypothetical protein
VAWPTILGLRDSARQSFNGGNSPDEAYHIDPRRRIGIHAYFGHYGTQGQLDLGIAFANHVVPEPSPMMMAAGALAGLAACVWRKRR